MKYLLVIAVVLVFAFAIVFVMGMRLPKHHRAQNSAVITASPMAVWAAISDVAAGPNWRSDLKRVDIIDSNRWREYDRHRNSVMFRLDSSLPMHQRVVSIDDPGLPYSGSWTYNLQGDERGNTTITIVEDADVKSPVWRFFGHYVIGERSSIDRYLHDLQKSFEAGKSKSAKA
jgi:Polyketide cyclase / dehydrase and lipid transport